MLARPWQPVKINGDGRTAFSVNLQWSENPPQSTPSSRWPDQQNSADLNDRERGLARRATDVGIDSQDRMPPVFTRDQVAAAERPPEISTDRMLFALLVGALALTMAAGCLIFKYAAARRPRRGDVLDQRGSAWKWTELSPFDYPQFFIRLQQQIQY